MHLRHAVFALVFCLALPVATRGQTFTLKVIALNDLHGNLESPGKASVGPGSPEVAVGGVDYVAAYVAQLKSRNPDNIVVSAGDLTGASPLVSALFHDEDTIETASRLGLEVNAVGNHEFDHGLTELLRLQHGGCSALDANTCKGGLAGTPVPFEGAKFQYLAANVFSTATGETIFPAYAVRTWHGVKVGFIGLTLHETPSMELASKVAGLRFADEATTINANVRRLRSQGVASFIVLIHQGGMQTGPAPGGASLDINACAGDMVGSPIRAIVAQLDDAVGLVISAHTHAPYLCHLPNRAGRKVLVTSASAYGRMLSDIDLTLDTGTKRITAVTARNLLVDRTNPAIIPDPTIHAIVERYAVLAAPIVNRVVGSVSTDILKAVATSGESPMGDLIADAQLEATSSPGSGGAVAAFMNEGGIRTGLAFASTTPGIRNGAVTYGQLFAAQPFGDELVTMTLTGEQIHTLLEEQFKGCALGAPPGTTPPSTTTTLQVSDGFSFTWSRSAPPCHKVDPASMRLHGIAIQRSATYRITVNNLLADGGSDLYILKQGTHRVAGPTDLDAMVAYFAKHPATAPSQMQRIDVAP
jgi:5'-nucleotidase